MAAEDKLDLAVSIAGMSARLTITGLETTAQSRLSEWYAPFRIPVAGDQLHIDAHIDPGESYLPIIRGPWQIETTRRASRVEFLSYWERGWFDLQAGTGEMTLRPNGNPENYLRVLYAWRCLENGGLLLHAAGLVRRGRGFVFFGHSGAGKTTTTRLSEDADVLSDDLVILRCEDVDGQPGVRVYGVPFRGEMVEGPRRNQSAPLAGLFSLWKDENHFFADLPASQAVGRLASCTPFVMSQPADAAKVLAVCAEINRRVPVRVLHFRRDPGFWSLMDG